MKATPSLLLGITFFIVVLLAGCSGSGVSPNAISGTDIRTIASDHLSVIALLAGWLRSLYYRVPPDWAPTIDLNETLPDGTRHIRGTNSDGSTFEDWLALDGSGRGTSAWPDRSVNETYGPPIRNGKLHHQELTREWSTGLTMTVVIDSDFGQPGTPQTWSGEAAITGGSTMTYTLVRTPGLDHLTLALPDGSTLEFRTLVASVSGSVYWPQFAQGAEVVYTAGGQSLTYHLTGDSADWWQQMSFNSNVGFAGTFSIDDDFVGSGQLQDNGAVAGALGWDGQAVGRLNLLRAEVEEVTPSAAARDFRLDQWANHTALMGPAPMY